MDGQIESLSIKCSDRNQLVQQLSGGNKQKVVFGKWIGCGSEVLILDCPTRGVDIGVKQAMYRLMMQLKGEGKAILLISEEMPELLGMSDRILIMKDGSVQKSFCAARIKRCRYYKLHDLTEAFSMENSKMQNLSENRALFKHKTKNIIVTLLPIAALAVLLAIYIAIVLGQGYNLERNLTTIVNQAIVLVLVATGAIFIFTLGSFDISLGASTLLAQRLVFWRSMPQGAFSYCF